MLHDGELSHSKMWKLKKKLSPQNQEVPMAMQDQSENLLSSKSGLKLLYQTTYDDRLAHQPIKSGWEDVQYLKENLLEYRVQFRSEIKI